MGLFPHTLEAPTIQHMGELLMASQTSHGDISEFFDLLNLRWASNFCKFNGPFFEFPSKVEIPIGSLLGSLISEVFKDRFEKELFSFPSGLLDLVTFCACETALRISPKFSSKRSIRFSPLLTSSWNSEDVRLVFWI